MSLSTDCPSSAEPAVPATAWGEVVFAWLAAFLVVPIVTLVLAGQRLFDRPFWADETLSWLIASDPSFPHAMGALAGGIDTNAPLIHLFFRAVGTFFGHTPIVYRIACAGFFSLALVGLYLTLRRTLRVGPSIVGCLAFWSLPIVVTHQTEARFYGAWIAATIWTCYAIARRRDRQSPPNAAGLAVAAIVLCLVHYFGIIVLACVVIAEMLPRRSLRQWVAQVFPATAGVVATLCLWPLLRTQREALADVGGTWLPDAFLTNLLTCVKLLAPPLVMVGLLGIVVAAILLVGRRRVAGAIRMAGGSTLAALALFAVAMLAFDRLVQPVLVPRYMVPVMPAIALLIAAVAATLSRRAQFVVGGVLSLMIGLELVRVRGAIEHPQDRTSLAVVRSVESLPSAGPIFVDWRGHLLPIWAARPDLRTRLRFVDDRRLTDPELDQAIPFERRMVELMTAFYGFPPGAKLAELEQTERVTLVTEFPETVAERFPAWHRQQTGPLVFEMARDRTATAD